MMFSTTRSNRRREQHGWVHNPSGGEMTAAPFIIGASLDYLKKKRMTLVLTGRGYQSGATVLVDYGPKGLVIGKPTDWPAKTAAIRVHFKDSTRLSCQFEVQVLREEGDLLHTSGPSHIVRLQRRSCYRVETPPGCRATFSARGKLHDRFAVRDLSAGGMLCCGQDPLGEGTLLMNISLSLSSPSANHLTGKRVTHVIIPEGKVVRSFVDQETGLPCYGVAFRCGNREESHLLQYIRQREVELAKAAADE